MEAKEFLGMFDEAFIKNKIISILHKTLNNEKNKRDNF